MQCLRLVGWVGLLAGGPVVPLAGQDSLPQPVASAFRRAYPRAVILNSSKERRQGKVVYEIESRDGRTRRDLIYSAAGGVLEIEEVLPVDSVPGAVRAAAKRQVVGGRLVRAERVTRGSVILFEVQMRLNGRSRFLTYDPEGRPTE